MLAPSKISEIIETDSDMPLCAIIAQYIDPKLSDEGIKDKCNSLYELVKERKGDFFCKSGGVIYVEGDGVSEVDLLLFNHNKKNKYFKILSDTEIPIGPEPIEVIVAKIINSKKL